MYSWRGGLTHDPISVEETKSHCYTETGNDPETEYDCDLSPTEKFKVVMERRHLKESLSARDLKVDHL
jgi:hypothetical protein